MWKREDVAEDGEPMRRHQRLKMPAHDELGELAATFDHMLERLEAAFERQRQFTSNASHELRTPLAIADLEVSRSLTRKLSPEESQKMLTIIQQEIRYMSRLVNDLLTLARADAAQMPLRWESVDLSEIVVDTVEHMAPLAQEMGIAINVASLPELTMQGDQTFLVQLLVNIIENAVKYTAGSGSHVTVEMTREEREGKAWARLCVSDDGPGISQEHLAHLFERFYRTDQSRTHHRAHLFIPGVTSSPRGSGLGLAIAQWIAQTHGGVIQVQSRYGQGSTFTVWLPLSSTA